MARKYQYHYLPSKKHRVIALALCVMFGFFGLHYFYVRRYWRVAFNIFLLLTLTIASNVYGIYYMQIAFGPQTGVFVHWREAVAIISALILGLSWIFDIVMIAKGKFKDNKGLILKR